MLRPTPSASDATTFRECRARALNRRMLDTTSALEYRPPRRQRFHQRFSTSWDAENLAAVRRNL